MACHHLSLHTDISVPSYIDLRFADQRAMLITIKDDIANVLNKFKLVTTDEAKTIDRRLRSCANPAKNPDSSMYVHCPKILYNAWLLSLTLVILDIRRGRRKGRKRMRKRGSRN